jgi:hypothetical protein
LAAAVVVPSDSPLERRRVAGGGAGASANEAMPGAGDWEERERTLLLFLAFLVISSEVVQSRVSPRVISND